MEKRDWDGLELEVYTKGGLLYRDVLADYVTAFGAGMLAYLATPYSHICRDEYGSFLRARSIDCVHDAAAWQRHFCVRGLTTVLPIVMSGLIVEADSLAQRLDPLDGVFWESWPAPLLRKADLVVVPPIPGWRDSEGVWRKVRTASRRQVPVFLVAGADL